jgi:uncharacterized protein with ParB-like and HNH nuclease domain
MSELVYSIEETFSKDPRNGALGKKEASKYFIAPYQRGYKWSSFSDNDPVNLLMSDINDAFTNKSKEYYLQYITICKSLNGTDSVLEVIDGQQRLTTLTLLLTAIGAKLNDNERPITDGLLSYEVRPIVTEFFQEFIYGNCQPILTSEWADFVNAHQKYDEQDIYYLYHALKKTNELIPNDVEGFKKYVLNNVKLIVNTVEKNISSERIFANLNTNKIELTSSELIKALLLTKSPREKIADERNVKYKEIIERRALLGRQWDEIERWTNRPEIKNLFFENSDNSTGELLKLLALKQGKAVNYNSGTNELFNYFQSSIKTGNITAREIFKELRKLKNALNEWYLDDKVYNLIGYLLLSEGSAYKTSNLLEFVDLTKDELYNKLQSIVKELVPQNINELAYGEDDEAIHRLLLALSVFGSEERFDFYSFSLGSWSLEHIFPQNPKKFPPILKSPDIDLINSILAQSLTALRESGDPIIQSILNKLSLSECELSQEEIEKLCGLLKSQKINSIGNMALLTSSDNSSNSNGMFSKKRHNVTRRISIGSFVPKHTYDVFSKLLSEKMDPNLNVWSEKDIDAHKEWIENTIKSILG